VKELGCDANTTTRTCQKHEPKAATHNYLPTLSTPSPQQANTTNDLYFCVLRQRRFPTRINTGCGILDMQHNSTSAKHQTKLLY